MVKDRSDMRIMMLVMLFATIASGGPGPDVAAVGLADKVAAAYGNTTHLEMTAIVSRAWKDKEELHHKVYNVTAVMDGNAFHAVIHGDVHSEATKVPLSVAMRMIEYGRVAEFTFWEEVDGCLIDEFKRPSWLGENEPPWLKGIKQGEFRGKKAVLGNEYLEVVRTIEEPKTEESPYWKRVDTYRIDPKTFFILGVQTQEYDSPDRDPYMTATKVYTVVNFKMKGEKNEN